MSRVSVKLNIRGIDKVKAKLKTIHSAGFVNEIQETVVNKTIKPMIRSGISPVRDVGRFVQYKDPESYPGKRLKPVTPANLVLSGKMLSWYRTWLNTSDRLAIGIHPSAPQDVIDRALGNNLGTKSLRGKKLDRTEVRRRRSMGSAYKNKSNLNKIARSLSGVPARRFIPIIGEEFTVSVFRVVKDLYARRIKSLLSK